MTDLSPKSSVANTKMARTGIMPVALRTASCAAFFFCLAAAGQTQEVAPKPNASAVVAKDWRAEIGIFKFGMVRGWSSDMSEPTLKRFEASLSKALGLPVQVMVFERFATLIDAHAQTRVDAAIYSPVGFATAQLACECLTTIAASTGADGSTGLRSVVLAQSKADDTSNNLDERIGVVGDASEMLVADLGLSRSYDQKAISFVDIEAAGRALLSGEIEAIAAFVPARNNSSAETSDLETNYIASLGSAIGAELKVQQQLRYWHYGPVTVRRALSAEAAPLISAWLAQIDTADPVLHGLLADGLTGPFRAVSPSDYSGSVATIQQMVAAQTR
jgi:phosphonate transport system substrate-binding protein